ncbi:hypothetical protein AAKU64_004568 [Undibacterium sp. GrIS 1.8]
MRHQHANSTAGAHDAHGAPGKHVLVAFGDSSNIPL